jgi:hypothetical protein
MYYGVFDISHPPPLACLNINKVKLKGRKTNPARDFAIAVHNRPNTVRVPIYFDFASATEKSTSIMHRLTICHVFAKSVAVESLQNEK